MSMLRLAIVPALALLLAAAPRAAHAGEAETKAAQELVRLITPKPAYDDMLRQLTNNLIATSMAPAAGAPADMNERIIKAMTEAMPYEDMMTWTAEVYAKRFTAAELKELSKFYRTPLGAKVAKSLPEIMGEVGRKTGEILAKRLPAALDRAGLGAPKP
jgi:hypothetical protein